jgi:hypothetical protein
MDGISARARLVLRHVATSREGSASIQDLVRFSPVDGGIVDAKAEARENATAIQELIRGGLVDLWVIDRWERSDTVPGKLTGRVHPDLVLQLTDEGEVALGRTST